MENDQRLTPLPVSNNLAMSGNDFAQSYAPSYDTAFQDKLSLRQYLSVIYKRLPIILLLTLLTTAGAAFYMFRMPSIYVASAEMMIEPRRRPVQSKEININFGQDANYLTTQIELLKNLDLMKSVVIDLGLQRDPNLFSSQKRGFFDTLKAMVVSEKPSTKPASLPDLTGAQVQTTGPAEIVLTREEDERAEQYAGILLGGLKVAQKERTNLVVLTLQGTKPEILPTVVNKVGEKFIERDVDRETIGAKKALADLTQSISELRGAIASDEQQFLAEMQSSGLPLREGKGNDLLAEKLQTLSTQMLQAEDDRRKIQATYEAARRASGKGDILSVVGDNKAIQDARSQNLKRNSDLELRIDEIDRKINNAEEERQKLLVTYTEEYPKVKSIVAQIAELNTQKQKIQRDVSTKIESEGKKLERNAEREVLASLEAQLGAAQKREQQLKQAYMNEAVSANYQGQAETKLTTLKRGIETNRTLLDSYTQQQKERELAISSGTPENIKVSERAPAVVGAPIGPARTRNIFIAFLVSLAAGIGLVFLIDYLDDSVRSSDDVSRHVGLPTLALIPHQNVNDKRKAIAQKTGSGLSNALVTMDDKKSPMAEAYRHLRTSLLFSSAGKPPQSILVTSSQPSEGKTTTAINTAITLAQSGVEVVIIDCDLRRPRLHSHFNLPNSHGLTNFLSGDRSAESMLREAPNLPHLRVITSGPIPPNPAELLSSHEMRNLINSLRGSFKHIIIDSPPAISFTDAAILSTQVDGVILVAMAGKSSLHLMRRFKQSLSNIGARIYGVVLNGIKSTSMDYGYYGYGYSYNYYHRSEDDSTPLLEDVLAKNDEDADEA